MRRALTASAATVAGLVALLGYKSHGPVNLQPVSVGGGAAGGTSVPSSASGTGTTPAGSSATTAPAASAPTTGAPATQASRLVAGEVISYAYGSIQVDVTLDGRRIIKVTVPENQAFDGHSAMVNGYAVPILEQEALSAQGLNFNAVSGATFTSDAFAQSLQSALTKAGL